MLDRSGTKVWCHMVQRVTGFNHYLVPPLFGFSLPMSALLYLRDGPGGKKLITKQVGGAAGWFGTEQPRAAGC